METVPEVLRRLGGCATWSELREHVSERSLRAARRKGAVVRGARGRSSLPEVDEQRALAAAVTATLSHLSAAVAHGWKVKTVPEATWITVRRSRKFGPDRDGLRVFWADVSATERAAGITGPVRTVVDCARVLPFDEALAVADSALRDGAVAREELLVAAAHTRGPGATRVRRVAREADGRAANPFESVLRALCLDVGLRLTPQFVVRHPGLFAIVDLGSEELRLVIEAEGYETHGTREGLRRDCRRHTDLTVWGWASLRFTYEDVMFDQDRTRWAVRSWLDVRESRLPTPPPRRVHRRAEAA